MHSQAPFCEKPELIEREGPAEATSRLVAELRLEVQLCGSCPVPSALPPELGRGCREGEASLPDGAVRPHFGELGLGS